MTMNGPTGGAIKFREATLTDARPRRSCGFRTASVLPSRPLGAVKNFAGRGLCSMLTSRESLKAFHVAVSTSSSVLTFIFWKPISKKAPWPEGQKAPHSWPSMAESMTSRCTFCSHTICQKEAHVESSGCCARMNSRRSKKPKRGGKKRRIKKRLQRSVPRRRDVTYCPRKNLMLSEHFEINGGERAG